MDGDGKTDLAVANQGSNTVSVFRNTSPSAGTISFDTKVDYTTGTEPWSISIDDLDKDGKADLAVTNFISNTISVFRNTSPSTGTISFAPKVDFMTGTHPASVSIGDLDGDGMADLAVANLSSNTVSVLRNTSQSPGIISYADKVDYTTGTGQPYSVAIGDLDGDGKADLAVANDQLFLGLSVFRNTSPSSGIISYDEKVDYGITTASDQRSVSIDDLNGDGKPDLVVVNTTGGPFPTNGSISVFRNTSISAGSISYATNVDYVTGGPFDTRLYSASIGDLDGDGKPDLATVNVEGNTVGF